MASVVSHFYEIQLHIVHWHLLTNNGIKEVCKYIYHLFLQLQVPVIFSELCISFSLEQIDNEE